MNSRLKRRLVVVTGVIVIVIVVVLAIVSSTTASHTISVAQATSGSFNGSKVQVTGKVVDNSFVIEGDVLSFSITEDAADSGAEASADATGADASDRTPSAPTQLKVIYDKGVSATFGNQVTAICTGTINQEGVLICTELVTQCPSKYESSVTALGVAQLLDYGSDIFDKPVKVTGTIKAGTLGSVGQASRFVLVDATGGPGEVRELPIGYDGALSADIKDGSTAVLTGSLLSLQKFAATDVALKA